MAAAAEKTSTEKTLKKTSSVARSNTTLGGCMFEDLWRGRKSYACDPCCLVDLRGENDISQAEKKLIDNVHKIFTELEIQRECSIVKFYIGKTFIRRRRKPGGFQTFDPMDPSTWKKNGISSRWRTHRDTQYGRDGLVVLTAITKQAVPKYTADITAGVERDDNSNENRQTAARQEGYALTLEQKLIHHFRYASPDDRLHNETANEGKRVERGAVAYAVYVAFKLVDNITTSILEEEEEMKLIQSNELPLADHSVNPLHIPTLPTVNITNTTMDNTTALDFPAITSQSSTSNPNSRVNTPYISQANMPYISQENTPYISEVPTPLPGPSQSLPLPGPSQSIPSPPIETARLSIDGLNQMSDDDKNRLILAIVESNQRMSATNQLVLQMLMPSNTSNATNNTTLITQPSGTSLNVSPLTTINQQPSLSLSATCTNATTSSQLQSSILPSTNKGTSTVTVTTAMESTNATTCIYTSTSTVTSFPHSCSSAAHMSLVSSGIQQDLAHGHTMANNMSYTATTNCVQPAHIIDHTYSGSRMPTTGILKSSSLCRPDSVSIKEEPLDHHTTSES